MAHRSFFHRRRVVVGILLAIGAAVLAIGPIWRAIAADQAEVRILSVEELGPMEQPASIQGRDGGVSGRFAGRSVWVYGDSIATLPGTYPSI